MVDLTVFVGSCDRYSATWLPFCHGLQKYWPDCPWPLRFLTNYGDPPCGKALKVGEEENWTDATRRGLEQVESGIVLYLMDDYWLTRSPDTKALSEFARILADGAAEYVLLFWNRRQDEERVFAADPRLFVVAKSDRYRATLQPTLWRREVFLDLLEDGETPWQFEIRGSVRSGRYDNFLSVSESIYISYVSIPDPGYSREPVVKGKWTIGAVRYARREGLDVDFSTNPDGTASELSFD